MTTRNWKDLKKTPRQLKAEEAGRKFAAEYTEEQKADLAEIANLESAMPVPEAVEAAPATAGDVVGETITVLPTEAPKQSVEVDITNMSSEEPESLNAVAKAFIAFENGGVVENTQPVFVGERVCDHVIPVSKAQELAKMVLSREVPEWSTERLAERIRLQGKLQVLKLDDSAKLPTVAHPGEDLGYDIYANETVVFSPNETRLVSTGIVAFQEGHGLLIRDRSSMALKGFTVSAGVIDAGYRGELKVLITNNRFDTYVMHTGDKIAQMLPLPVLTGEVIEVTELPEGRRGEKGYGSSGR